MRHARGRLPILLGILLFVLLSIPPWGCGDQSSKPDPQEQCIPPYFDPQPGDFDTGITVTIRTETPDCDIYYTLDGSEPDEGTSVYSAPLAIATTTVLKSRTMKEGFLPSEITSGTYRINPCTATILSPNGGEKWELGTVQQIQWTTEGCGGPVRLELYHDGAPCLMIALETEDDGSFDWTVTRCGVFEDGFRIRVTRLEPGSYDESDAPFRLVESCDLRLLTPGGGEVWTSGTVRTISWSGSAGCGDSVRIELLREGTACGLIAESAQTTGTLDWIVAGCGSETQGYRVRVTDPSTGATDASDGDFRIDPPECPITLLVPNGGETWTEGEIREISWSQSGCGGTARIDLLLSGSVCRTIAEESEDDGSFEWTVTGCAGSPGPYKVRITRSGGSADESDAPFTIEPVQVPCTIQVDAPSTGAIWQEGTVYEILWTSDACAASVRIDLMLNGLHCRTLFAETENDGQAVWRPLRCGDSSQTYTIRVSESASGVIAESGGFAISPLAPPPCSLELTSPDSGDTWFVGYPTSIRWSSLSCGPSVRIELLCNGVPCDTIAAAAENDGDHTWFVTRCCASICGHSIRITDPSTGGSDTSEGDLCIQNCQVEVTSPIAGDVWESGSERMIVWESEECGELVSIRLLQSGNDCREIAVNVPNTGSYLWFVEPCSGVPEEHAIQIMSGMGETFESGLFRIEDPIGCSIDLSYPNGGETWPEGERRDITWASSGCSTIVRIDLLLDDSPCATIAADAPNTGAFPWTPVRCGDAAEGYKIRVSDPSTGTSDVSASVFSIPPAPPCTLPILRPDGGEQWLAGSVESILWQPSDCDDSVRLELLLGGSVCATIAESTEDDGAFEWTVSDCEGSQSAYGVRITGLDSGATDQSDQSFSIVLPCEIEVAAPSSGEEWVEGSTHAIAWASENCGSAVAIDLLRVGVFCRTIVESTPNDGEFEWTVAGCSGSEDGYSIRVRSIETGVEGVSDNFSIPRCELSVIVPAAGDSILAGSPASIAWSSSGPCGGSLRIELLCAGDPCAVLADDAANDGSFEWTAWACCDDPCGHAIRVFDPTTGRSATGGLFCICPPCTVEVTSPSAGESWIEGSDQTIRWTAVDCGDTVRIDLVRNGEICLFIDETAPNSGSYTWNVQNCGGASDGYAIRITGGCDEAAESAGTFSIPECALAVTSPNGGETISPGASRTITWNSSGPCGDEIRIDLVRDGVVCATLSPATPNDGSFDWTAQPCGGNGCGFKIRISDPTTGRLDDSNAPFCICPDCPQHLTVPNGGEEWEEGTLQQIAWDANAVCDATVRLDLIQNGFPCLAIAESTPNDGSFAWTAARCGATAGYKIRVTGRTCGQSDESDGGFSIPLPPCAVTVLSPAGGESWESRTSRTISWTASETCGGSVRIELLRSGTICRVISASTPNDGSHPWTVEPCDGLEDGYAIRIVDLSSGISDTSDTTFTIPICTLEITRPAGGEVWQEGTTEAILWNSSSACGANVRLDLVRAGAICRTIASRTANDGRYDWIVQNCGTAVDGYSIRISDSSTGGSDDTDGVIQIPEPPCRIEVTSPAGGEIWSEGAVREILWSSFDDCGGTVRIELVHSGEVCAVIHPETPNDGAFTWTALACEATGSEYTVRIVDIESGAIGESPAPFTIATAGNLYALESGVRACRGDTDLTVDIRARNSEAIGGYGVRVCFDPAVFECLGTTVLGTRGETHDYFDSDCGTSCVRAGVIVGPDCASALDAGDGAILKLILRVKETAPIGPTTLLFQNQDPSYNTMAPCDGGTLDPLLLPGTIEICGGTGR